MLGVFITPSLSWKSQFEHIRKKMNESVTKLMATSITTQQAYLYFNIYLISSVYFGAEIISLNKKQCKELKKIYEEPILVKLKLSRKLPRELLYTQRVELGIGLISPKIAIAVATLRLYFSNMRMASDVSKMIAINEEYTTIESGLNEIKYQREHIKY